MHLHRNALEHKALEPNNRNRSPRRPERGFTLVELMIVVAIIGILASLAAYMFGGQRKKTTAKSEVASMFTEMMLKQEQYLLESGSYLSTSDSESVMWPGTPSANGGKQTLLPFPDNWSTLRIAPETTAVLCSYVMIAGEDKDSPVGTIASTNFSYEPPNQNWYYVLARCNMDQNSAVDSYYFQRSGDSELYFVNQGK